MARSQSVSPTRWTAEATVEVSNLSVACVHVDSMRGQQAIRTIVVPTLRNGVYYFDVGRRIKAMIIGQLAMLKSEAFAESIKTGVWFDSLPTSGEVPIVRANEFAGVPFRQGNMDEKDELVVLDGLPYPLAYVVPGRQGAHLGYRYAIQGPVCMRFSVESVARRLLPEMLEEILTVSPWHLGDHSSQGFGRGKLVQFKVTQEPMKFRTL